MARLLALLLLLSCRGEPTPPPPSEAPAPAPTTAPPTARTTTSKGGIVEPRTITSERQESGEIRENHERSDGSLALEALYRDNRVVRMRAMTAAGKESWACELVEKRPPMCVMRDQRGEPLSTEAQAARNFDARQRLDAARKLLAPADQEGEHAGHNHSHFKVPPPTKEAAAEWQKKRTKAWADSEPWFIRVDALQDLGLPTVVATALAKEELSSGFWIMPAKKAIEKPTAKPVEKPTETPTDPHAGHDH